MTEQTAITISDKGRRTAPPSPPMTTAQLLEALHGHFIKPQDRLDPAGAGAVFLTEVTAPDGSGRRADAVHIGLWQSRGAGRIDVCELKTSRADFRRELEQPAKAEAWWPYSTTFSIVSPGVDITPPEDLPPGWGLLVPNPRAGARRFRQVVVPEERAPKLTVGLLGTLLKCTETVRTNALAALRRQMRAEHAKEVEELRSRRAVAEAPNLEKRLKRLDALEEAMGLELDRFSWDGHIAPEEAADALKEFMRGYQARRHARDDALLHAQRLEVVGAQIRAEAAKLRAAHQSTPEKGTP
ncbi:hypothetical protein ABZ404_37055 [Streptomyces sp. NPDC005878]|uniref:hypothetical protein n=1 Tax=Streptomyces sp. NPDC005878 TaxID=3157077 RepID=UPI0033D65658